MYKIAIVDDDAECIRKLKESVLYYGEKNATDFEIFEYREGRTFCLDAKESFDVVFLDVEMPVMDGMEAAKRLRRTDSRAVIIFVTEFAKYAVNGYEVDATDFIVKPVVYESFKIKMSRALKRIAARTEETVVLQRKSDTVMLAVSSVKFVEIMNHSLAFHTFDGIVEATGSLKKIGEQLLKGGFSRCNNYTLVNLRHVTAIDGYTVTAGGEKISVSRARKKQLLKDIADFHGGKA